MLTLSRKTRDEIETIAAERGCRLLAVETSGTGRFLVLRVVLERDTGDPAGLQECETVSREVSAVLDASDEIRHRYTLEVSSAGLDRKLYSVHDAVRFLGHRIRVRTERPVVPEPAGPRAGACTPARNFQGTLRSVEGEVLTVVDEENRKSYNVRFGDIRLARLQFEWPNRA